MRSFILIALFTGLSGCAGMSPDMSTREGQAEYWCSKPYSAEYKTKDECKTGTMEKLALRYQFQHSSIHDVCVHPTVVGHYKDYNECFAELTKVRENRLKNEALLSARNERQQAADENRAYSQNEQFTAGMKQVVKGIARQSDTPVAQPIQANCTTMTYGNQTQTNCN